MFWAAKGVKISIEPQSGSRVWLDVPLNHVEDKFSVSVIQVSVEAADLERAIEEWKAAKVTSHA